MTAYDDLMREFREFKRYTGDGLPGAPVNAPLPVGDPQSGVWNPKKANLRLALGNLAQELMDGVAYVEGAIPSINAARDAAIANVEESRDQSIADLHAEIDPLVAQTEAARDIAVSAASAVVSGSNVPIRNDLTTAATLPVPDGQTKLIVLGEDGGTFVDADYGSAVAFVSAAGDGATARNWYREPDVGEARLTDLTLQLINRPKRPDRIKLLLTADWQAIPEQAAQVAAQRAMMDDIQAYHSDVDFAINGGDLVDRPTDSTTGALPSYGYREFLADIQQRIPSIPLSRWLLYPGNHDRDGTGAGSWQWANSYHTYMSEIGPLFYYVDLGNTRMIFLGDMSGSVGGEILNVAVDWFRALMAQSVNKNVIIGMHQPPDPTVYTPQADPNASAFQYLPARVTDIIAAYDNVAFCMYGHVGGTIGNATLVTENVHGTTWVNCQMGVPTAVTNGFVLHYSLAELIDGASTFEIRRWDATNHDWLGLNDVTITTKYAIQLSGDTLDFDGRVSVDHRAPYFQGPVVSYQSARDFRASTAPYAVSAATPAWGLKAIVADDSNDSIPAGFPVGVGFYVPGQASVVDSDGYQRTGIPGYGLAGGVAISRIVGANQEDFQGAFEVWLTRPIANDGALEKVLEMRHSQSSVKGMFLLNQGSYYAGIQSTPGGATGNGAMLHGTNGAFFGSSDGVVAYMYKRGSDGRVTNYYRDTTNVGGVTVTTTATSFNTSSDAELKLNDGELTFDQARAILDLISFHNFRWKSTGEADHGVFAQELYEVYPRAVTVGGWVKEMHTQEDGTEIEVDVYQPWSVDYSKLVTVIGRCVQGVMQRHDEIDLRLENLEKSA